MYKVEGLVGKHQFPKIYFNIKMLIMRKAKPVRDVETVPCRSC